MKFIRNDTGGQRSLKKDGCHEKSGIYTPSNRIGFKLHGGAYDGGSGVSLPARMDCTVSLFDRLRHCGCTAEAGISGRIP